MSAKFKAGLIGTAVVLIVVVMVVLAGWVSIPEGQVGVQTEKGAATGEIYEPGWHVQNPVTQGYESVDTRPQTVNMVGDDEIKVLTQDGQDVFVDVTVRYKVTEPVTMFEQYQTQNKLENRMVHPTVRSDLRDQASDISARDIITQDGRESLAQTARESLQNESDDAGIEIQAVQVRNVNLNKEFSNTLEQIEIAENNREQKRINANADAEAERIRAEGDADAMEIRNEQLTEEILALEQIDAYDKGTVYVTEGGTPVILEPEQEKNSDN